MPRTYLTPGAFTTLDARLYFNDPKSIAGVPASKERKGEVDGQEESEKERFRARLNCIFHLLGLIPYKGVPFEAPSMPKPKKKPEGVPDKLMYRHIVPENY